MKSKTLAPGFNPNADEFTPSDMLMATQNSSSTIVSSSSSDTLCAVQTVKNPCSYCGLSPVSPVPSIASNEDPEPVRNIKPECACSCRIDDSPNTIYSSENIMMTEFDHLLSDPSTHQETILKLFDLFRNIISAIVEESGDMIRENFPSTPSPEEAFKYLKKYIYERTLTSVLQNIGTDELKLRLIPRDDSSYEGCTCTLCDFSDDHELDANSEDVHY